MGSSGCSVKRLAKMESRRSANQRLRYANGLMPGPILPQPEEAPERRRGVVGVRTRGGRHNVRVRASDIRGCHQREGAAPTHDQIAAIHREGKSRPRRGGTWTETNALEELVYAVGDKGDRKSTRLNS